MNRVGICGEKGFYFLFWMKTIYGRVFDQLADILGLLLGHQAAVMRKAGDWRRAADDATMIQFNF
jgi:hypothetical protein